MSNIFYYLLPLFGILFIIYILGMFLPVGKYIDRFFGYIRSLLPDGFNTEDDDEETQPMQEPAETDNINEQTEKQPIKKEIMTETTDKRCLNVLHELGCTTEDFEDGWTMLTFQGETFILHASPDSVWVFMRDLPWYDVSLDDIDEVALVRKVVNETNKQAVPKLVYIIDNEDNKMHIESRYDFVLFHGAVDVKDFFISIFNDFFRVQRKFFSMLDKEHAAAEK